MEINKDYYIPWLDSNIKSKKKQIILAHTSSDLDDFFVKITTRFNTKYNKVPHYVISRTGLVYQLVDYNSTTRFMEDESIDKQAVSIALENVGWLLKDPFEAKFFDWKGHEYHGEITEVEWRKKKLWATYTEEQTESMVTLIKSICTDLNIHRAVVADNLPLLKPKNFKGILNRSNYNKNFYDLSPAMDFIALNEKLTS